MQLEDTPEVRGLEHRGGTFHSRIIAEGKPGTPGNFKFSLSRLGTDYSGPRHRHNFEQYRFMIEGESDYGQDGPLKAGMLGYYPEGVPYGPQVNKTGIHCAVLQFGGASGSGYLLPREVKAGMEGLARGYAARLAKDGITVNAVAPSLIETEMTAPHRIENAARIPLGRLGTGEDVASVVLMVLANAYMTGQTVQVNGGLHFN